MLGGLAWGIADLFGAHSNVGAIVIVALAAAGAFGLWTLAQRNKITADDLDRTNVSVVEEAELSGVPPADRGDLSHGVYSHPPYIDWSALWKIILAALIGGAGVVIVFGFLLSASRSPTTPRAVDASGPATRSRVCAVSSASQ